MRNNCIIYASSSARKSKIELKIAMKTWDILKATYLIALLHISSEIMADLFELSRCIKYLETRAKRRLCSFKGVRLLNYSSETRSGTPLFYYVVSIPS